MVHENCSFPLENRAPMIRYRSAKQLRLAEFDWPFQSGLDENNRWVKLAECIPWDELAQAYHGALSQSGQGRPSKDARLVIGAVVVKHKLCVSDRETVAQIQENPYLQYFVGLSALNADEPRQAVEAFDRSLQSRPGAGRAMLMAAHLATHGRFDEALHFSDLALARFDRVSDGLRPAERIRREDILAFQEQVRGQRDSISGNDSEGT